MKTPASLGPTVAAEPVAEERNLGVVTTVAALDSGAEQRQKPSGAVALPTGTTLGRYVVLGRAGEGGMGVVYAAYDPELDRKIALKLLLYDNEGSLHTEGRTRLLREAQAMARLSHPHVIAVHDVGVFDGQVFIAMEFVDGTTLRAWLGDRQRTVEEIVAMFTQAGQGLSAAHAEGIVHRDFKPDNVLIGKDGRARVLDFGLAHAEDAGDAALPPSEAAASSQLPESGMPPSSALGVRLTRTGAFMGTPMYMAPEQFRRQPTDARTDQFSFCVALYEALYGESPFAGEKVQQRAEQVLAGHVRDEPKARRLPPGLRRALLQGLSVERSSRFASMKDLLQAIALRPPRSPWRWAGVAAAMLVPAVALGAWISWKDKAGAVCEEAEQKLLGVWDRQRKQAVHDAFLASGKPYAQDAFRGVERALDAYAQKWTSMHTDACLATHVRGEQSGELLDLRMECLSQRLGELRALTEVFAAADAELVERSVQSAQSMTSIDGCADIAALKAPVRPPPDVETRAKVEHVHEKLARVRALQNAGRFAEARSMVEAIVPEAVALKYRPVEAEALDVLAGTLRQAGDLKACEKTFIRALVAAQAGRHDRLAASIWISLVTVQTFRDAEALERARATSLHAAAMLERLGDDPELAVGLEGALGTLARYEGHYDDAVQHYSRALDVAQKLFGPDHLEVALSLQHLAAVAVNQGKFGEAVGYHERSLAIREKAVGSDHPSVATSLAALGNVLANQGKHAEARKVELRALAIMEKAFGPDHPAVAEVVINLANLDGDEGRFDGAIALYERVLAIQQKASGANHVRTAPTLNNIGATLVEAGKHAAAIPYLERCIALQQNAKGPSFPELAMPMTNLGNALLELGRTKEARVQYEHALKISRQSLGDEHPYTADALVGIGKVHMALRNPVKALPILEQALAMRIKLDEDPALVAEARFLVARALWDKGTDRKRARELAGSAREAFAAAGIRARKALAEADAWLQAHPSR